VALDLFVLHRRAQEVSLKEAARWTAVWLAIGLGFGGLLRAWEGESTAQAYLAGYLIEKSLSLDNVFVFAVIFAAFAIPARYQHRVLMFGIVGALIMRAAFIVAGVTLMEAFHPVIYVFGAVLLYAAVKMVRGGQHAARPEDNRVLRAVRRVNFRNLKDGRTLAVDGLFGPKTEASVRAFQKAMAAEVSGFRVDGIVGPQTWQALVSEALSG
jgi:tellurite resistance protein TerC